MEINAYRAVRPLSPLAAYVGGKKNLAPAIIKRIEATPHDLYAEPFVGMGGIFLRRERVPETEIINDRSKDVAIFFRIVQRHYQAFLDTMKWQLTTRADFERLINTDPETLTDLERSARFLYLQRLGFGGKVIGRNFGTARSGSSRFDLTKLAPLLDAVHERLSSVVIECLDFEEFIERYDRSGALFYLDPPYWGSEGYYGKELFSRDDFKRLANALRQIKGQFFMSINDTPGVREVFSEFKFEELKTTYTVGGMESVKDVSELLFFGGQAVTKSGHGWLFG